MLANLKPIIVREDLLPDLFNIIKVLVKKEINRWAFENEPDPTEIQCMLREKYRGEKEQEKEIENYSKNRREVIGRLVDALSDENRELPGYFLESFNDISLKGKAIIAISYTEELRLRSNGDELCKLMWECGYGEGFDSQNFRKQRQRSGEAYKSAFSACISRVLDVVSKKAPQDVIRSAVKDPYHGTLFSLITKQNKTHLETDEKEFKIFLDKHFIEKRKGLFHPELIAVCVFIQKLEIDADR